MGPNYHFQTCNIITVSRGANKTVDAQEPTKTAQKGVLPDTSNGKQLAFVWQHAFSRCMQNGLISP